MKISRATLPPSSLRATRVLQSAFSWAISAQSISTTLLATVIAYILVVFVLCPGNPLIGFPVHHDDFTNLGSGVKLPGLSWRPVSYFLLSVLSGLGITFYYASLHVLVILYVFFSLRVLHLLLDAPQVPLIPAVLIAAGALSYESTIEYSKYTGLITNLLSGGFAVVAMFLIVNERQRARNDSVPRTWMLAAALSAAALSFWSKEDFILPSILVACYVAFDVFGSTATSEVKRPWGLLAAGMFVLAGLLAAYHHLSVNPLLQSASGPYLSNYSPFSISKVAVDYLLLTQVAVAATMLQISTLIWNAIAPSPIRWSVLLLIHVLILSLLLPYSCLPNHVAPYYCVNWVVWQIGGSALVLWKLSSRVAAKVAIAALMIACVLTGQPTRQGIAKWYDQEGQRNRRIVELLKSHAAELRVHREVIVEGAPYLGPWFANGGQFLAREGLDHEWLVRVPRESQYYRTLIPLVGTSIQGSVRTVAIEDGPSPLSFPVVRLSPDGSGTVELSGSASRNVVAPKIVTLVPSRTLAGTKFQVQPDGRSAIAVSGSGFIAGAIVMFGAKELETAYGNAGLVSAIVPEDLIARAGTIQVSVRNPDGGQSQSAPFQVDNKKTATP
jgi:hypothetical protein